ncbi:MAG: UDP binding domain-containing protein, partial [Acidobacteriota bacterium]
VNELKVLLADMDIDVWEVIEAASTKPFGFQAFYPGPGLGGHCIPIDPHYLSWKLKTLNYYARFIELAAEINAGMPRYVVDKVVAALNRHEQSVKGSRILIVGVAYKRDVGDTRESPALDIIQLLRDRGAEVVYNDPFAGSVKLPLSSPPEPRGSSGGTSARPATGLRMESRPLTVKLMKEMDCTVIVTDHTSYDYQWLVDHSRAVVDTRNATRKVQKGREKILKI